MNVKQGDFVNVDGVESLVETSWGAGKHRVFKLSDGRTILDLDKLVASGKATIVPAVQAPKPAPAPVEAPKKNLWNS